MVVTSPPTTQYWVSKILDHLPKLWVVRSYSIGSEGCHFSGSPQKTPTLISYGTHPACQRAENCHFSTPENQGARLPRILISS
jgi:hypothetical protein